MVAGLGQQVVIAGAERIHQTELLGLARQPMLPRGDLVDVEVGSVLGHESLEALVDGPQLLAKLLPPQIVVLAEHGDGALVLARGVHLELDVVLFQEFVEVRQLGNDADGADDGKGGRQYLVRHAGHHVAAARRHLVDGHRQRDVLVTQALQLGGRQAIAVHHAAAGLEAQQHLVPGPGDPYHGAHLFPQGGHLPGIHAAVKIEHKEPAALVLALGARLLFGLARLVHLLALGLAGQGRLQLMTPLLQLPGEIRHHQLPLAGPGLTAAHHHQDDGAYGQQ